MHLISWTFNIGIPGINYGLLIEESNSFIYKYRGMV